MSFLRNYCDFNPRLFREFTSMKTKVKPELADDWVIENDTYNTTGGVMLYSKKLNQKVADINLRRLLDFFNGMDIVIKGLKIQGSFIIGNDRTLYSEEHYNTWKAKYDKRTETILAKKDLKVGHKYKTPCGKELIYAGSRYTINLKESSVKQLDFKDVTKVALVHYVIEKNWRDEFTISKLTNKLTRDLGKAIEVKTVEEKFEKFKYESCLNVYLEKVKPTGDEVLTLVEKQTTDNDYKALFIESNNELYCSMMRYSSYYVTSYSNRTASYLYKMNRETLIANTMQSYGSGYSRNNVPIEKSYVLRLQ